MPYNIDIQLLTTLYTIHIIYYKQCILPINALLYIYTMINVYIQLYCIYCILL